MLNYSRNNTQKISSLVSTFAKIYITEKAYMQMSYIIKNSDIEVGWLSTVSRENNNFIIEECFLLEQEAHSTTCELKEEALNKFALELIENNDIETYDKLKCWCHSHVNMGVNPSGQDDKQMNLFKDNDYFLRGIGNKKGEMKFDIFDFQNNLLIEDVPWELKREESIINRIKLLKQELELLTTIEDVALEASIKDELKEKVKKISYYTSFNKSKNSSYVSNNSSYYKNIYDYEKNSNISKHYDYSKSFDYDKSSNCKKNSSNQKSFDTKFNMSNYDDYDYNPYFSTFNSVDDDDSDLSLYDYFEFDELMETYKSLDYNDDSMREWIKSNMGSISELELDIYIQDFKDFKEELYELNIQ